MQASADDPQLAALCRKIEHDRGFFCSSYKDTCLRRRISVRMRVKSASNYDEYARILDDDPVEYDRLISTLTINVSKFFRNPETYASIATTVLPELAANATSAIRIWSAGCASGEEAYTLAVLSLQQAATHTPSRVEFQILGTDVDQGSLSAAKRGRYPEAAFVDTTPSVRDTFFAKRDGLYSASPEIRALVAFEHADLLDRGHFARQANLIVCRNVIIYFRRQTQERLLMRFHELLQPGGFLVLGKVESLLGKSRAMFTTISSKERIYRRA